jgi:exodeoxyribonuclease VII small subunit
MAKGAEKATPTGVEPEATKGGGPEDAFDDVTELSYEQARDELISVVAELEGGQLGLEESMRLWQRGEALAAHCSTWLDGAEAALNQDQADQPG